MDNIILCMPCKSDIPVETSNCVMATNVSAVRVMQGSLIDDMRDMMAKDTIKDGYTHLLFIDSDMVFKNEDIERLIADDKDVVTGICFKRVFPYTPAIYRSEEENYKIYADYPQDSLFEVDACGMAFCLIKVEALKAVLDHYGTMFMRDYPLGEDMSFCKRWKSLSKDNKIYCDSRAKIGHIGTAIITEETYKKVRPYLK